MNIHLLLYSKSFYVRIWETRLIKELFLVHLEEIDMVLDKLARILIAVAIVFTLVGVGYWIFN